MGSYVCFYMTVLVWVGIMGEGDIRNKALWRW